MTDLSKLTRAGVVCLFCGTRTPIPMSMNRAEAADAGADANLHVSLVRCLSCGKEAPYLASEVIRISVLAVGHAA
jgi:hypothetical protein